MGKTLTRDRHSFWHFFFFPREQEKRRKTQLLLTCKSSTTPSSISGSTSAPLTVFMNCGPIKTFTANRSAINALQWSTFRMMVVTRNLFFSCFSFFFFVYFTKSLLSSCRLWVRPSATQNCNNNKKNFLIFTINNFPYKLNLFYFFIWICFSIGLIELLYLPLFFFFLVNYSYDGCYNQVYSMKFSKRKTRRSEKMVAHERIQNKSGWNTKKKVKKKCRICSTHTRNEKKNTQAVDFNVTWQLFSLHGCIFNRMQWEKIIQCCEDIQIKIIVK